MDARLILFALLPTVAGCLIAAWIDYYTNAPSVVFYLLGSTSMWLSWIITSIALGRRQERAGKVESE